MMNKGEGNMDLVITHLTDIHIQQESDLDARRWVEYRSQYISHRPGLCTQTTGLADERSNGSTGRDGAVGKPGSALIQGDCCCPVC